MSFPVGRWFGVDVRFHLSFALLFVAALAYGTVYGSMARGFALFFALVFAVAVRETARAIAAAYIGLRLRALFLLPVGGVMAFSASESNVTTSTTPLVIASPLSNFGMGLLLAGISYAAAPGIHLWSQPWISPQYVLRSVIWTQFVLGMVNLLPVAALPTRQLFAAKSRQGKRGAEATTGSGSRFGIIAGVAVALIVAGFVLANVYLVMFGFFCLLGSQLESQLSVDTTAPPESLRVEEVMLTEFPTISSSDTLRGALAHTVHSLHDVFAVVRGNRLVGSVTRQTLEARLQMEGDGYVQGVMTKSLQVVQPHEELLAALRRAGGYGASEFLPVAQEGRVVGMLASQTLSRAVQQVNQARVPLRAKVQE